MIVIGLISGTSYDAIETAAADFQLDAEVLVMRPLGARTVAYSDSLRDAIHAAMPPAQVGLEQVCKLDTRVGQEFAAVADLAQRELCGGAAEMVASHGQTLFHWIEDGHARGSLQLGQPAWIARTTGLPVVSDLRAADIAAGGQGAPLVSRLDCLLLADAADARAALNLGGIANVTIVDPDRASIAYDTGPANALLDAATRHFTEGRESFDVDGARAARGRVVDSFLDDLLRHPYYAAAPPKSTGKEVFNLAYLLEILGDYPEVVFDDAVATLTMLTARTVGQELKRAGVREVVVSGGGTQNPTLMRMLAAEAGGARISTTAEWGLPPLAKEAYAFALLGWLSFHGVAGTVPSCTGATEATVLGRITPGRNPLRLPDPVAEPRSLHLVATAASS